VAHKTIEVSDRVLSCCSPISEQSLSPRQADDLAQIFGVLGDPARLRILSIVASAEEVCSCALEAPLGKSQPTISHHTRVLAEAGLISGERRGRWVWWRVVPERMSLLAGVLSTVGG
jgi:ArsR family transcriptional regulator, arsenate/arsenite/antimonite-responsive transcriptional repressor